MASCNLFLIWCHTELMTRFIYVVGPILTRRASGFCASMIKWEEEYMSQIHQQSNWLICWGNK